MEPISILYHETFSEFSDLYQIEIRELSDKIGRKINMQFCRSSEIANKLASNPNQKNNGASHTKREVRKNPCFLDFKIFQILIVLRN